MPETVTLPFMDPVPELEMGVMEKYRQLAEACLQKAISAHSTSVADAWLSMARSWIAMQIYQQRILSARDFLRYGVVRASAARLKARDSRRD